MTKSKPRNRPHRADFSRQKPDASTGPGWLWGTHAVEAALANPKRRIVRMVATANALQRLPDLPKKVKLETVEPGHLDRILPEGAVHQGIALLVEPLSDVAIEDLIEDGATRLAILDQVSDPHNLGAIWRSAAAFGVDALVLQTRHTPPVTGIVAKSAAGAVEQVAEVRVVNIARTIDTLKEAGWTVIGLTGEASEPIAKMVAGEERLALVLGAEGAGLRQKVAEACTFLARIPMKPGMESLNVSNAAAIAFYEAMPKE